jgi:hypothetical protein
MERPAIAAQMGIRGLIDILPARITSAKADGRVTNDANGEGFRYRLVRFTIGLT